MLRIRRSEEEECILFALSGRIEEEDVPKLQELLGQDKPASAVILDLEEVRLVDREAVRFLAACESQGIRLQNCPSYVRKWMHTGSDTL
jgi:hypothetical protein